MSLLILLAFVLADRQPSSVIDCGADPSGETDSTRAFQTCLNATRDGDILIPRGHYRLTHPIFKTRNQNLQGSGVAATVLQCEMLSGPCIVAADAIGGPNNYRISEIRNLGIEGSGSQNNAIGVFIGADPDARFIPKTAFGDGLNFSDVRINGFRYGIQFGNNAWSVKLLHCALFSNAVAIFAPKGLTNSGEAVSVTDSTIFNNGKAGVEDQAGLEWFIYGTSFDYNKTAFIFFGATVHVSSSHFEQQSSQVFFQPFGMGTLSLRDSEILVQASTGSDKYILDIWPQLLVLTIDDVSIWSNHAVQYFMRTQGNISGSINNLHGNGNKKIQSLTDNKGNFSATNITCF